MRQIDSVAGSHQRHVLHHKPFWNAVYASCAVACLWVGRTIGSHTEWLAVPICVLVVAMGSEVLQSRRRIPRSMRRIAARAKLWTAHMQMVAFMMVCGLASGHLIARLGLDPYLRNPLNILEDGDMVRAREAADLFPQRAPEIRQELQVIRGLIDSSNLTMAQSRLRDVDGE